MIIWLKRLRLIRHITLMTLGRAYWCKECRRAFDRERNHRPDRRLQIKLWEQSERGKELRSQSKKLDRERNKQAYRARRILNKMIKGGFIKHLPCQECGNIKSMAHHPDYSKPIDVVWVCQKHHSEIHRTLI